MKHLPPKNVITNVLIASCCVLVLTGCGSGNGNKWNPGNSDRSSQSTQQSASENIIQKRSNQDLNTQQIQALSFIVQEEKLARDVYGVMYATRWINKFDNILNAEENHQTLVANILTAYGIINPNDGKSAWQFEDKELQTLYTNLIDQWKQSSNAAIQAGITIEQKDIADIQDMMWLFEWYDDIQNVLQKLLDGSQRHLAAFSQ